MTHLPPEVRTWLQGSTGGWRTYEGGGGVKGKMKVLCFEWQSEQSPPLPEAGGIRAQPHLSSDASVPYPLSIFSEIQISHLPRLGAGAEAFFVSAISEAEWG